MVSNGIRVGSRDRCLATSRPRFRYSGKIDMRLRDSGIWLSSLADGVLDAGPSRVGSGPLG